MKYDVDVCQNVKYGKGKFRQKKAAAKEEEERRKGLSKERSRRYHDKKRAGVLTGQSMMPTVSPGSSSSPSTFQSSMAQKRAVDKTKNILPKTPEKKVENRKNVLTPGRKRINSQSAGNSKHFHHPPQ